MTEATPKVAGSRSGEAPIEKGEVEMNINDVLKYLPHRYPMLLIDRVISCEPGKSLTAIKNVTYNENFFQGHFPNRPVMPAVLILEAMAQATGIFALKTLGTLPNERSIYYFVGVDKARFRRPVEPGDQMQIEVRLVRTARGVWKVESDASVDGVVAASAELMGALREIGS
ncbi:MAG TPA: 3-hydroxyacyl-ACP dehydratase FabZ [Gammaproteobacteria bacterium]|nr:3-hydroxyacyl-ACP dehydratase FabZ [Gammaproteobacteria bacterium]